MVDRRRAFFVVVMLALYPIFNFKGFKYNPDLLQLVTLPLVVLAYLHAFEKRTVQIRHLWLGLAGALALMTKYWVLTMIGAIGIAALMHPERLKFLRSPAPWVAIATLVVAMIPHLVWLKEVDFLPLTYAGDVYGLSSRAQSVQLVLGLYRSQSGAACRTRWPCWRRRGRWHGARCSIQRRCRTRIWSRGANPGVNAIAGAQCLDHPDRGRGRAAARRPDFRGLYEDRLGNLAVLPGAAGAGRDAVAARYTRRSALVLSRRDLARDHARDAGSPRPSIATRWK